MIPNTQIATVQINPEKLSALPTIVLTKNNHPKPTNTPPPHLPDGACVMELVSYLADEPWSDHPECACRALTACAIKMNDYGPQWVRDKLRDLAPRIVGTRANDEITLRRVYVLADCAAREVLPWTLDTVAGVLKRAEDVEALRGFAKSLREVTPITDRATAEAARDLARKARQAGYAANAAAYAAYAAAYAAYAANAAAYAATAAADAATAKRSVQASRIDTDEPWRILVASFERALEVV